VSLPLEGVRIVDLTNVLAGPFCAYQLALLGAEIIKIEQPEVGDLARQLGADADLNRAKMGTFFLAQNAGKRSITLNLKSERGQEVFRCLLATADVVLENFRPGVMERLGLGYDSLRKDKPDLIYCAITGFGQDGPLRDNPAYDQIVQGLSGIMSVTGDETTAPQRVGYQVCDTVGGLTAAFAVAAALYGRAATGEGQYIDVSMLDSSLATLGWHVANWTVAGAAPRPAGNENPTSSPSGTFRTRNGHINIAANEQAQFETLCALLDRPDLARDPRFAEREARKTNRALLRGELEKALATRDAEDWEARLNAAGVPAGRVLSIPEILDHPQIKQRDMLQRFAGVPGVDRAVAVARGGFRLSGGRTGVASPPPALGADTEAVLRDLGYDDRAIAELRSARAV
jgi:crotonobetainyl-CoA:carnitine CoA-transferase CaiB-like acyl-CoA transferase